MLAQQITIRLDSHNMLHNNASEDTETHACLTALRLAAASLASSPPSPRHNAIHLSQVTLTFCLYFLVHLVCPQHSLECSDTQGANARLFGRASFQE